jgi:hypothetical protein
LIELSGSNSYSGGTTLDSYATIIGNTNSLQGNINLTSISSGVDFQQSSNGTYSGAVTGEGALSKDGTGTLFFSGTFRESVAALGDGLLINAGTVVMQAAAMCKPIRSRCNCGIARPPWVEMRASWLPKVGFILLG